jgi:hypothetical protein
MNMNPSLYNQFSIHHDQVHPSNCSASCNGPRYPPPTKLTLPSPISPLPLPTIVTHNNNKPTMTSACKAKVNIDEEEEEEKRKSTRLSTLKQKIGQNEGR